MQTDIDLVDSINSLMIDTWSATSPLRDGTSTRLDVVRARVLARKLEKSLSEYQQSEREVISKSTLWLAQETIDAVRDLVKSRYRK